MKQFSLIFSFLIISMNAYCDTIDYWHVYVNNKLVAKFDENSKNLTVSVKKSELNNKDIITVKYGSDHPCIDCIYVLTVLADVKRKMPEATTKEHLGKLSISVKELLDIQRSEGINRFDFNYHERRANAIDKHGRLLFVLSIDN